MLQEFANGYNARLYYTDKEVLKPPFNRADLVRVEQSGEPNRGFVMFCEFRLLNIIFPGHFPIVVGCKTELRNSIASVEQGGILTYEPSYYLYSKMTNTPSEHAHFGLSLRYSEFEVKESTCPCEACLGHRTLHEENRKKMCAFAATARSTAGVMLPFDDLSDWCVDVTTGEVIFFEINSMDYNLTRNFVQTLNLTTSQRQQTDVLLKALKKLDK